MKSVFSTHPETSADPSVDACAPPSQPILVLWRTLFNDHTGAEEGLRWLRYFLGDTRWCVSVGILLEPAVAMDRLRKWADQDPTMQEVLSQLQGRVYACRWRVQMHRFPVRFRPWIQRHGWSLEEHIASFLCAKGVKDLRVSTLFERKPEVRADSEN